MKRLLVVRGVVCDSLVSVIADPFHERYRLLEAVVPLVRYILDFGRLVEGVVVLNRQGPLCDALLRLMI